MGNSPMGWTTEGRTMRTDKFVGGNILTEVRSVEGMRARCRMRGRENGMLSARLLTALPSRM